MKKKFEDKESENNTSKEKIREATNIEEEDDSKKNKDENELNEDSNKTFCNVGAKRFVSGGNKETRNDNNFVAGEKRQMTTVTFGIPQ